MAAGPTPSQPMGLRRLDRPGLRGVPWGGLWGLRQAPGSAPRRPWGGCAAGDGTAPGTALGMTAPVDLGGHQVGMAPWVGLGPVSPQTQSKGVCLGAKCLNPTGPPSTHSTESPCRPRPRAVPVPVPGTELTAQPPRASRDPVLPAPHAPPAAALWVPIRALHRDISGIIAMLSSARGRARSQRAPGLHFSPEQELLSGFNLYSTTASPALRGADSP